MPKAAEVDDIHKNKADDDHSVDIGPIPIEALQFSPHDKFIEGKAQGNAIDDGKAETDFFASFTGEEEVIGDGQENDAVGKVVEVDAADS